MQARGRLISDEGRGGGGGWAPVITQPPTKLINHFITNRLWPRVWKSSNITSVFKKASETNKSLCCQGWALTTERLLLRFQFIWVGRLTPYVTAYCLQNSELMASQIKHWSWRGINCKIGGRGSKWTAFTLTGNLKLGLLREPCWALCFLIFILMIWTFKLQTSLYGCMQMTLLNIHRTFALQFKNMLLILIFKY